MTFFSSVLTVGSLTSTILMKVVFHMPQKLIPGTVLITLKSLGVLPISLPKVFVLFSFLQPVLIYVIFIKLSVFFLLFQVIFCFTSVKMLIKQQGNAEMQAMLQSFGKRW